MGEELLGTAGTAGIIEPGPGGTVTVRCVGCGLDDLPPAAAPAGPGRDASELRPAKTSSRPVTSASATTAMTGSGERRGRRGRSGTTLALSRTCTRLR